MKTQDQDKATARQTVKPQSLSPEQEAAWEAIQDRHSDLTDKYLAIKSEHAALVAVAEAAKEFKIAAEAMDTSYKTSDFLPGEKQRRYCDAMQAVRGSLADLAAVREGGAK